MKGFNGQGRILKAGFISLIGLPPPTDLDQTFSGNTVTITLLYHDYKVRNYYWRSHTSSISLT